MWISAPLPLQDITSLLHTIYEVVDSSVNHSPTSSKTLRVKLTVAPDGSQSKKSILLSHPGEGWRAILDTGPGHSQLSGWIRSLPGRSGGSSGGLSLGATLDRWDFSRSLKG